MDVLEEEIPAGGLGDRFRIRAQGKGRVDKAHPRARLPRHLPDDGVCPGVRTGAQRIPMFGGDQVCAGRGEVAPL